MTRHGILSRERRRPYGEHQRDRWGDVKRLRKRGGLTQEHVAQYLGIDQTLVSKVEAGQRSLGVASLERLCDLFFCTLDDLLDDGPQTSEAKAVAFRADGFGVDDLQALAPSGASCATSRIWPRSRRRRP